MLVKVGMRSEWTLSGKEAVLRARQSMEMGDAFHAYICLLYTSIGDVVLVKDLAIASNPDIDLMTDPEAVVVTVTRAHNAPEEETRCV